jgi:hypothetical protein
MAGRRDTGYRDAGHGDEFGVGSRTVMIPPQFATLFNRMVDDFLAYDAEQGPGQP